MQNRGSDSATTDSSVPDLITESRASMRIIAKETTHLAENIDIKGKGARKFSESPQPGESKNKKDTSPARLFEEFDRGGGRGLLNPR